MKRLCLALFSVALLAALGFAAQPAPAPPELPFESVPNFFKYPFEMNLGDLPAVAVNSKGHVYMASRSNVSGPAYGQMGAQVLEFDQTGKYLREVGKGLYAWSYLHGIRVDKEDNIWVADKGSDMVVKLNPVTGHLAMVFGRRAEASAENGQGPPNRSTNPPPVHANGRFRQPTDMAWDSAGNTYIADGYTNSRIAVFDKNGDWVRSFGEHGTGPGQFRTLHNIAIDGKDRIYIADRTNARIQVFDRDFKFLYDWKLTDIPYPAFPSWFGDVITPGKPVTGTDNPGAPWALCITPGPTQYLYVGDGFPGRIYKMTLDGRVLGTFGRSGRQLGQFGWVHGLACPSENELYAADENNFRVQKLVFRPEKRQTNSGLSRGGV